MTNKTGGTKGTKNPNSTAVIVDNLEQVGDTNFYRTPDALAKLLNCDRWPSNPYCGNIQINAPFLLLTPPKIVIDECGVCITAYPNPEMLGTLPITLCYVRPECQPKPKFSPSMRCLNANNAKTFFEELDRAVAEGYIPKVEDVPPHCDQTPNIPERDGSQIVEIKVYHQFSTGGYVYRWVDGNEISNHTLRPFPEYIYYRAAGKNDFKLINYAEFEGRRSDAGIIISPPYAQIYSLVNSGFGTKVYQNSQGVYLFVPQGGFTSSYSKGTVGRQLSEKAFSAGGVRSRIEINGVTLESPNFPPLEEPPLPSPQLPKTCCCCCC